MPHVRKQIRDAVKTALTGLATTGTNVFASRVHLLNDAEMPGLLIYATSEQSEVLTAARPARLGRSLSMAVEGVAKATSALDDTLDAIAAEVETAMAADETLGGLAKALWLASTDIRFDAEAEKPVGAVRLTFEIEYHTLTNAPEAAI